MPLLCTRLLHGEKGFKPSMVYGSSRRMPALFSVCRDPVVRLYWPHAVWKDVGQALLDGSCQQLTGSHEEGGCWPGWS
jgi:hypothetical protein